MRGIIRYNIICSQENEIFGGIAQLGERLHGMQEVSGSIPLISTKILDQKVRDLFLYEKARTGFCPGLFC